jgi:hypothetical protein
MAAMTHRERLETAWSFSEADRVPIEIQISPHAAERPESDRVRELIAEHADNLVYPEPADWGFFCFPSESSQEIIEDRPGEYRRIRRI